MGDNETRYCARREPWVAEVTVRLNRFGLEEGRGWPALIVALAIAVPLIFWTIVERGASQLSADVPRGNVISIESYPEEGTRLSFAVPSEGWKQEVGVSPNESTIQRGSITVTVNVSSGVNNLRNFMERRTDHVVANNSQVVASRTQDFRSHTAQLDGFWADLVGRSTSGAIVVLNHDSALGAQAAISVVALAPAGRLDEGMHDLERVVDSMLLEST